MKAKKKAKEWVKEDGSVIYRCLVYPNQVILTVNVGDEPGNGYMYSTQDFLKGERRAKSGHIMIKDYFSEEILNEILDFIKTLES